MDTKPFGVKLKTTGMDVTRGRGRGVTTTHATTTTSSRSIRTPLKPANVKDLKAMFDHTKDKDTSTTKSKSEVKCTSSVPSASVGTARSHGRLEPEVKVTSTSLSSRSSSLDSGKLLSSNVGSKNTKDSGSVEDLLSKYRSNRTGYYKETDSSGMVPKKTATHTDTRMSSSSGSSVTRTSSDQPKLGIKSEKIVEFNVPKLNLGRITSAESSCSKSTVESQRPESGPSSPRSSDGGSPKLIGKVMPKYLPTSTSSSQRPRKSNENINRIEIPVSHHLDGGLGKTEGSKQRLFRTGFEEKKSNGGKTTVSKVTTEVRGPSGTRTKTVEITQTQRTVGFSPVRKNFSVDTPIPWSDKSKLSGVSNSEKIDNSTSGDWLEKKNARNFLSNFVSSAQTKRTVSEVKIEREIPVQRVADSAEKTKPGKLAWTKKKGTDVTVKQQPVSNKTSEPVVRQPIVTKVETKDSGHSLVQARKKQLNSGPITKSVPATKHAVRKLSSEKPSNLDISNTAGSDIKKMVSRKMSAERFQRLKFDFERGVPTESSDRRDSDSGDHIDLKKRVLEIAGDPKKCKISHSDSFKRKEESIFASGLKVSDFVAQVDSLEGDKPKNAGRKWKKGVSKMHRSSKVIEDDQDHEYLEVPDRDETTTDSSEGEGIYEFVPDIKNSEEGVFDNNLENVSVKGRRKQKGIKKPSFKIKTKSNSLPRNKKVLQKASSVPDLDTQEKVLPSEGEEDWETDSNSTTYEPVDGENLYEEADFQTEEKERKKKKEKDGQSLGDKLKAKVPNISAQATNVLNRIGNKLGKIGKQKGGDSGMSAGTDSEADVVDEALGEEIEKLSSLSRSSSERSSGKGRKNKDSSETGSSKLSEDEGMSCPTPPPLPPRSSRILTGIENSPPLPPRNTSTSGMGLDTVVPVADRTSASSHSTGDLRKKGRLSLGKDSYLYGQQLKSASLGDVPGFMDDADGEVPDAYMDYDPVSTRSVKSDTDKVERREKTSTLEERPVSNASSAYIYPDGDSWPVIPSGSSEDSGLYLELDDDQVYGQLGRGYITKFESEPLYQFYNKDHVLRASRKIKLLDISLSDDEEGGIYEDVGHMMECDEDQESKSSDDTSPSKRSTMLDVLSRTGSLHRALWCEMPEVREKGVLDSMDPQEKRLQEAMFEIITSEASYLKSLNVLINVFLMSPDFSSDHSDRCVLTKRERQILFSNIGAIRDASERFLADLEDRWQESCVLTDICDIIYSHSLKNFEPYVRYTSNQTFQERALENLKKKTEYMEAVRRLERNPDCQCLPMSSFLLLPMQRITRLPLLVDAICHRLEPQTDRHMSAAKALENLNRVVKKCNDGAKKMQQTEQMCLLANQLDFKVKEFPLISASRHVVKQGELTRITSDTGSRIPFGKRSASKQSIYLFLFNDMLLVAKKKGNMYSVTDYCQRNSLHVEAIDNVEKCRHLPHGVPGGCKNLFLMVILENHERKQIEMVLSCDSPSDRTRWIGAVTPVHSSDDHERIYEDWDCPQVQCERKYVAKEPDELSLEESDVVNVFKKINDGWYEGERIRDGERGWFPASQVEEIMNSHVRARNLKLRYRLMMASQDLTENNSKNNN